MATLRGARFYVELGARLRSLRVRAGLSQAALGARLGRSASAIDRYEMGQRRIAVTDLVSLAGILGIAVKSLLEDGGPGRPRPATAQAAERSALDRLRAEHRRLLRALDRRLLDPRAAAGPAHVAEHPRGYGAQTPAVGIATVRAAGVKIPRRRLQLWARRAGLPVPADAEALGRFAALVLASSPNRTGPGRFRSRRLPR